MCEIELGRMVGKHLDLTVGQILDKKFTEFAQKLSEDMDERDKKLHKVMDERDKKLHKLMDENRKHTDEQFGKLAAKLGLFEAFLQEEQTKAVTAAKGAVMNAQSKLDRISHISGGKRKRQ
eukprot:NODE_789_length_697_cov_157.611111_g719_i0.p1 GENE.NODE_789_length_697_cov_157.611111_g719_i0~~NODE_789_length_697_cov_157.611111_g719_i0.p1  ORF type:complete len:121 (-),score=24.29 NODE_789_length_697_cov_157.611111_g719_i0:284-646(-)